MKLNRLALGISLLVLILVPAAFAVGGKVAVDPPTATVYINGPTYSVELEGFCNTTPCNLTWILVLSSSNVGSLDTTTGPVVHFAVGTTPGTAMIIVRDGQGNSAHAAITVQ